MYELMCLKISSIILYFCVGDVPPPLLDLILDISCFLAVISGYPSKFHFLCFCVAEIEIYLCFLPLSPILCITFCMTYALASNRSVK